MLVTVAISTTQNVNTVTTEDNLANDLTQISASLDLQEPKIFITSPLTGSLFNLYSNVIVNTTASDNIAVSKVEIKVNGAVFCSVTNPPYNCKFKASGKPGSTITIEALAYDNAGNRSSTSTSIQIK